GLVGLRLSGGTAEIAPVTLDDTAAERGSRLAERVLARASLKYGWGYDTPDRLVCALLALLHDDDRVLREPVAPLHTLLPAEPPARPEPDPMTRRSAGPYDVPLQLFLRPEVYDELGDAADRSGTPLGDWVAGELSRLVAWPALPPELRYEEVYGDEVAVRGEWPASPVLRLDRFR
ncbi:MAG: hypothetical protein ACRDV2_06830, partial [Actinomycetes bacterium]